MLTRVAVFLDYNNMEAVSRNKGIMIDYGKLLNYLADKTGGRECISAIAYAMLTDTDDVFVKKLYKDGFIVKCKSGESGIDPQLGMEMVMDTVRIACQQEPDVIVLVSDNPAFDYVIQYIVKELSIRVEVAGYADDAPEICSNLIGYINLNLSNVRVAEANK